jgi:glycosyltransferase involved in cell wall biosynthesis
VQYAPGDYALYTGRLSREKGLPTLVAAFEGLGIPLKIAGDGPLRGELERRIAANPAGNVALVGHQSGEALARLIREAAFVVVPSEWYENAPMTVLEAFGHGKPVLAARIGGIPELVEDGENGALFPAGDRQALAQAANRLWVDRPGLEQMGRSARRTVIVRHSREQRIAQLLEIYREVGA